MTNQWKKKRKKILIRKKLRTYRKNFYINQNKEELKISKNGVYLRNPIGKARKRKMKYKKVNQMRYTN